MTRPESTWSNQPGTSLSEESTSPWLDEDELPSWKALSSIPVAGADSRPPSTKPRPPSHDARPPSSRYQPVAPKPQPLPPRPENPASHQSPPIGALLAAAAALLLGTGFGAILVFRGGADSPEPLSSNSELAALSPTDAGSQITSSRPPTQLAFEDGGLRAGPGSESTDQVIESDEPVRRAVFAGGIIYLRGRVPSVEISDAIFERASMVMGPDHVVNEYVIDPSVTFDPNAGAPLYVQDLVLFPSGSAEIDPQFAPLLDLGISLLSQNPQVKITVIGHTDAQGDEFENLALSQERVQAVLNYWTRAGVDPARITIIGKGEAEPIDDNTTPEGRQFNRRVEFIIAGLLAE